MQEQNANFGQQRVFCFLESQQARGRGKKLYLYGGLGQFSLLPDGVLAARRIEAHLQKGTQNTPNEQTVCLQHMRAKTGEICKC